MFLFEGVFAMPLTSERKREIISTMRKAHLLYRGEHSRYGEIIRIGLTGIYTLEGLDPKHRDKVKLNEYYAEWKSTEDVAENQNFFRWLNVAHPEFKQMSGVTYIPIDNREQYKIHVGVDGVITRGSEATAYDTTQYKGKVPGMAAYVMDGKGNMYVGEHQTNVMHHSSFLAGNKVISAGMVKIEEGKITRIDHQSGHYAPTKNNFKNALAKINKTAFHHEAKIEFSEKVTGNISERIGRFFVKIPENPSFKFLPKAILSKLVRLGNSILHRNQKSELVSSSDYYKDQQDRLKESVRRLTKTSTSLTSEKKENHEDKCSP